MDNKIKIVLILVVGALIGEGIYIYFSPYQSCVRAGRNEIVCAHGIPSR